MQQVLPESPLENGWAGLVRPTLAQGAAASARNLAQALGLGDAAAERLVSAVSAAGQPPAVAASLLGLAADDAIAAASAALHATPLWDGDEAPPRSPPKA